MQEENKEFDLLVRSMLENAEARPSRGVWKAISSRLDARPQAQPVVWARWAAASLALAAALGAALFFRGTSNSSPIAPERSLALLSTEKQTIKAEFDNAAPLIALPARQKSVSGDTAETGQAAVETAAEAIAPKSTGTEGINKPASRKKSKWKKAEQYQDDLDLLAAADSKKDRRKLSLYAKGSIGGNDSDFRFSPSHTAMAPGEKSTGFTELSTSTYGVPLTLGLGVRYHVLPRLSAGTGIDYSLLTRTFTGKYSGISSVTGEEIQEAGNVAHSLQYIGIPLGLYYDLLGTDRLKVYVYGLGEAEYCISSRYTLFAAPNIIRDERVQKLQYSIGGGLGIEFSLSRILGLYVDPGIRYYFPSDQPKSIRTDKPVMISFDAGLRFNF